MSDTPRIAPKRYAEIVDLLDRANDQLISTGREDMHALAADLEDVAVALARIDSNAYLQGYSDSRNIYAGLYHAAIREAKALSCAAQMTGGVAGADPNLQLAIERFSLALSASGHFDYERAKPINKSEEAAMDTNPPTGRMCHVCNTYIDAVRDKDQCPNHASTEEFAQLMTFYGVTTLADLVRAQAQHVEQLQQKEPRLLADAMPGNPRSG